jgi:hypothetical protein
VPLPVGRLGWFVVSACAPGRPAPEPACEPLGGASTRPGPHELAKLDGRYEVTMVNVNGDYGDRVAHGTLILWPNDSARRYLPRQVGMRPGERPLAGSFEIPGTPEHPAVEMVDGTIYLGGLEYSDGGGDELVVQQITPTGFRGAWHQDSGFSAVIDSATGRKLRNPSGHFCAVRAAK